MRAHKLENQAIAIVTIFDFGTGFLDAFARRSAMDSVGCGMTRRLSDKVFASAGANRDDVGVNELHGCIATNEVQYVSCCTHKKRHANLIYWLLKYSAPGL